MKNYTEEFGEVTFLKAFDEGVLLFTVKRQQVPNSFKCSNLDNFNQMIVQETDRFQIQ